MKRIMPAKAVQIGFEATTIIVVVSDAETLEISKGRVHPNGIRLGIVKP